MAATVTPDKTLDVRGIACALVMAKTKMALEEMQSGQVLKVISNDACTEFDLPAWAESTGRGQVTMNKDENAIRFFIRKH